MSDITATTINESANKFALRAVFSSLGKQNSPTFVINEMIEVISPV